MVKITAAQLQSDFDHYRDLAQHQPVSVTENGEESLVIMSADQYRRLKSFDDRQAFYPWELPDEVIEALEAVEVAEESAEFNHEYKRGGATEHRASTGTGHPVLLCLAQSVPAWP